MTVIQAVSEAFEQNRRVWVLLAVVLVAAVLTASVVLLPGDGGARGVDPKADWNWDASDGTVVVTHTGGETLLRSSSDAASTDDLWLSNNWAQQNVNEFIPVSGSPYEPVEYQYSVNNDGITPERVRIEPNGLPEGMKLTVTPGVRVIDPGETAIFQCELELDHTVIDAGCEGDREFRLVAWRETPHTQERWGAVKYTVRPRERSETSLERSWQSGAVHLYGSVTPPAAGEQVLLRLDFAHGPTRWHDTTIKSGGTFTAEIDVTEEEMRSKYLEVFARYEGNKNLGIGAEVSALVAESEAFDFLDAEMRRVTLEDVPMPYNESLEDQAQPSPDQVVAAAKKTLYVE